MRARTVATALVVVLAGMVPSRWVEAQLPGLPGSTLAREYRVDMAIPESPAFKLLDTEPGTVLRPGLPSELNAIVSRFVAEGRLQLPDALALEVSPALLIAGPRLERASYAASRLLYATRISAASATAADGVGRDIAFGVRFGIVNDADLRLDDAFALDTALQITPILTRINQIHSSATERSGRPGQRTGPAVYTQSELDEIARLSATIRQRWADRHWNARAFDVALGMRASALDDRGTDTRMTAVGAWATYAHGFGQWGQLLAGGRAGAVRGHADPDYTATLGLGLRAYVGSNALKAFAEVQDEFRENVRGELLFNSGAEVRIDGWIWASAALGFLWPPDGGTTTRTSLRFHTSFPRLQH